MPKKLNFITISKMNSEDQRKDLNLSQAKFINIGTFAKHSKFNI